MFRFRFTSAFALVGILMAGAAGAQVTDQKSLTLDGARQVAAAAAAEARCNNAGGAIAVVDAGGHLLYLERLDGTFAAAAPISIEKARSAAVFQRDTAVFEDAVKSGRVSLVANKELLPLQGGVVIMVGGQVVGAVGVSGANNAQQDEDIAKVAAAVFSNKMTKSQ